MRLLTFFTIFLSGLTIYAGGDISSGGGTQGYFDLPEDFTLSCQVQVNGYSDANKSQHIWAKRSFEVTRRDISHRTRVYSVDLLVVQAFTVKSKGWTCSKTGSFEWREDCEIPEWMTDHTVLVGIKANKKNEAILKYYVSTVAKIGKKGSDQLKIQSDSEGALLGSGLVTTNSISLGNQRHHRQTGMPLFNFLKFSCQQIL